MRQTGCGVATPELRCCFKRSSSDENSATLSQLGAAELSNGALRAHRHTPSPSVVAANRRPETAPEGGRADLDLSPLLSGVELYHRFGSNFQGGEIVLTARFADGKRDQTNHMFICVHKCAVDARCPPLSGRADMIRGMVRTLNSPPFVDSWVRVIEAELSSRPDQLPQICVGVGNGVGKLYIGGLYASGGGTFPDFPLARNSSLHKALPDIKNTKDGFLGEVFGVDWQVNERGAVDPAGNPLPGSPRFVSLQRRHAPSRASVLLNTTDMLQEWLSAVELKTKPKVLAEAWRAVGETRRLEATQLILRSVPYDPNAEENPPPLVATTVAVRPTSHVRVDPEVAQLLQPRVALLSALKPLVDDEHTLERAAMWATEAEAALKGRAYVCDAAQLGITAEGSLVTALYYVPVPSSSGRLEFESPTSGQSARKMQVTAVDATGEVFRKTRLTASGESSFSIVITRITRITTYRITHIQAAHPYPAFALAAHPYPAFRTIHHLHHLPHLRRHLHLHRRLLHRRHLHRRHCRHRRHRNLHSRHRFRRARAGSTGRVRKTPAASPGCTALDALPCHLRPQVGADCLEREQWQAAHASSCRQQPAPQLRALHPIAAN